MKYCWNCCSARGSPCTAAQFAGCSVTSKIKPQNNKIGVKKIGGKSHNFPDVCFEDEMADFNNFSASINTFYLLENHQKAFGYL
jgi:hypothetical protein